eukprot:scaffold55409_cov48-Attheya_sp.AAC.1
MAYLPPHEGHVWYESARPGRLSGWGQSRQTGENSTWPIGVRPEGVVTGRTSFTPWLRGEFLRRKIRYVPAGKGVIGALLFPL